MSVKPEFAGRMAPALQRISLFAFIAFCVSAPAYSQPAPNATQADPRAQVTSPGPTAASPPAPPANAAVPTSGTEGNANAAAPAMTAQAPDAAAPTAPGSMPSAQRPASAAQPIAPEKAPALSGTEPAKQDTLKQTSPRAQTEPGRPESGKIEGPAPISVAHPGGGIDTMHMFWAADPVVKGVMVSLFIASILAWTILIVMVSRIVASTRRMMTSIQVLVQAKNLAEAERLSRKCHASALLDEALYEVRLSAGLPAENMVERVKLAMRQVEQRVNRGMTFGLGVLAIIGSTGPFVGLFGTVWGIMHSFISIANSHTTNLSVVAPGIAEALLATAIGLVAAIPAVVFYNLLTRRASAYRALVSDAESLILRHLSRDLDRRDIGIAEQTALSAAMHAAAAATVAGVAESVHSLAARAAERRAGP